MSKAKAKANDHRRIAWRLSWRIAGSQIAVFIAIDILIIFLIVIARSDPHMGGGHHFFDKNVEAAFAWLRGIRYLDITAFWALLTIVALQILLLIGQAVEVRRHVRKLLEPLRELRVASDAFAGAAGDSAELRRMAYALHNVEASDMNAHIAEESVSPELRPLLEAIKDMLDRLEAAYASQAKFVSDASHELRTPIAVIQGYANLLSRWGSEDPETLHESIEAIRSEAEMMKQMVNQLLFLARSDSDTLSIELERVDLVPIAEEVLREELMLEEENPRPEGEGKPVRHDIVAQLPEESVYVSADAALIKQLMRILADNSVKYTPAGGSIRLSVAADKEHGHALVMVQDEGQGIPEEFLPKIFDRFVRADEARTRNTGGSGLGLSIAKQIAEMHGGTIEVFSVEGVGSRFTVILPLASETTVEIIS